MPGADPASQFDLCTIRLLKYRGGGGGGGGGGFSTFQELNR